MAEEPLPAFVLSQAAGGTGLFRTLGPVVETLGLVSVAVLPAVGATACFSYGARGHFQKVRGHLRQRAGDPAGFRTAAASRPEAVSNAAEVSCGPWLSVQCFDAPACGRNPFSGRVTDRCAVSLSKKKTRPAFGPRLRLEVRKEVRPSRSRTPLHSTQPMWAARESDVRFSWICLSSS